MEFKILQRDIDSETLKSNHGATPSCGTHLFKLERYVATEEKFEQLVHTLSLTNCEIDKLEISKVTFSDTKADNLAKGLLHNDTVTELVITKSKLRKNHIQMICDAIATNEAIQTIRLENVNVLESAGMSIANALSQNVSLKSLTLIDAGIGDRAMTQIVKGISESICIEYIDLRDNLFEEAGFVELVKAMKITRACKVLKLQGLKINKNVCDILSSFFKHRECKIEEVSLHEAELDNEIFD